MESWAGLTSGPDVPGMGQCEEWAGLWCPAQAGGHWEGALGSEGMGSVPAGGQSPLPVPCAGTEPPLPPSHRVLPAQGRGDPGEHPEEEGLEVQYGSPCPPWLLQSL